MSDDFFYSSIIEAKDSSLIPLCKNKSTGQEISLHSKYNPVREGESFASQISEDSLFIVVLGLAGAYHIAKICEKFPKAKILAVEISKETIDFLSVIPQVKKILENKAVIPCGIEELSEKFLNNYKPSIHGNLTILSLRQWESVFSEQAAIARKKIMDGLKCLSADYSVQKHFGKIWQKNILSNLSLAEKTLSFNSAVQIFDLKKTAAIIAAGPSLDQNISELKNNRGKYYIIATDTAFSALTKEGIESDAVVSIDGQIFSHEHYMEKLPDKTLYVFDLCANAASVRKAIKTGKKVLLSESGHPLAQYASLYKGNRSFIHLEAGSGTVTIAAASLAKKAGFSKISFFGADFAYIEGRPYCRGSYLEKQFHAKSNRFHSAEHSYCAIMYRTPLRKISPDKKTTEILEAYRLSLADFMKKPDEKDSIAAGKFNLADFKSHYCNDLKSAFTNQDCYDEGSYAFTTLLPLCAKLGKDSAFLAYLKTLSYTEWV
ncbi:MAG: DUF115 domain-containing protein [Treponema sp.]|nr:DUF115 domain-containing protein [Treponema sp.]